jgi:hypothetical protein
MQPSRLSEAFKSALVIFGPVLVVSVIPALALIPLCAPDVLENLIIPAAAPSRVCAWAFAPSIGATCVFAAGLASTLLLGSRRGLTRKIGWGLVWLFLSLLAFALIWYAALTIPAMAATDTAPQIYLMNTALLAALLMLPLQIAVVLWLGCAAGILDSSRRESTARRA